MTQGFMVFKQGGTQHGAHRCWTSLRGFCVSSWKPKKSTRMRGAGRHIGTMVSLLKNRSPSQCHIVLVPNRLPKPGICAFQLIIWWKFMIIKYLWGTINILRTVNKLKSWRIQDGREGILPGLWLTSQRCMECWTGPVPNWRQSLLSTYIWIFSLGPFVFSQFTAETSVGEK